MDAVWDPIFDLLAGMTHSMGLRIGHQGAKREMGNPRERVSDEEKRVPLLARSRSLSDVFFFGFYRDCHRAVCDEEGKEPSRLSLNLRGHVTNPF